MRLDQYTMLARLSYAIGFITIDRIHLTWFRRPAVVRLGLVSKSIALIVLALVAGCSDDRVPWDQAAPEIAEAFCDRCRPTDPACPADALEALSPLGGEPDPAPVDELDLERCLAAIAALETCDPYEVPTSCLQIVRK